MTKGERESINFKLPKPLVDALRTAASERNTTATALVIQGLQHVLGDVPGTETGVESRLYQLEEEVSRLGFTLNDDTPLTQQGRVTNLEEKLDAVSLRLAKVEGVLSQLQHQVNTSKSRSRSGSPYSFTGPPPQIQPFDVNKLALRLNTNVATLQEKQAALTPEAFEQWTRERDSAKRGWRYGKDNLYHATDAQ